MLTRHIEETPTHLKAEPEPTVVLLQQLRAALVAPLGQLHPGRRVLGAERLREVERLSTVPPPLSPSFGPQLRVFCRDLGSDGELVGDVLHAL